MLRRMSELMMAEGDTTTGGTGADTATGGGGDDKLKAQATEARTALAEVIDDPEVLKTLPDAKVVGIHGKLKSKLAAAIPVAPEKYELQLPEKSLLDPKFLDDVSATARELKLSNDGAKKFVTMADAAVKKFVGVREAEWNDKTTQWAKATELDEEIGKADFKSNVDLAKKVVAKFGSDNFKKALAETGFGNHPELVRFMVRVGKAMAEDDLVIPGSQSSGPKRSAEEILYDSPTS